MKNLWIFNKILFICYHRRGFPNSVKVYGVLLPVEGMGHFAGGNVFSLVINSSLKLKMNICILELSILFSKNLLFLYYIQVMRFGFFWEKSIFFIICFIALFYPENVLDFMIPYHIWYKIHFFQKSRKLFSQTNFIFWSFFRLKTKRFSRFYQKQNELKYSATINLCMKGKLKLGKI